MTDFVRVYRRQIDAVTPSRRPGYADAVLAAAESADTISIRIRRDTFRAIRDAYTPCGPGCQLRRSLAWWGLRDDGTCGCNEFAAQMDAWGPACWDHLEEIVDHLRAAAAARGIPFIAPAARMMVARAIEAAGREVAHVEVAPEKGPEADPRGAR